MDRTPYPAALRLYLIAGQRWAEIEASYYMVDLIRMSPAKFLRHVWAWCIERVPAEDREKWESMLEAPLEGSSPKRQPTEKQVEADGAAFMQAMQQHTALTGGSSGDQG